MPPQESGKSGALAGIRVIDFGQYIAGPLAALLLADNGAEIIRVDPPGGPRWRHPANAILQRSKRSIVLDLHDPEGVRMAADLISTADVVVEGFRPGVMDRLGLSADATTANNPGLIWCSIPGFGKSDPRAQLRGWEGIVSAAAGLYPPRMPYAKSIEGSEESDAPRFSAVPVASSFAAIIAAHSIVAALISRLQSGRGDVIEIPLFDAAFDAMGFYLEDPQTADQVNLNLDTDVITNPGFDDAHPYRCRDGRFLTHYGVPPRGLHKFFDAHLPSELKYQTDAESVRQVRNVLEPLFAQKDAAQWERELQQNYGAVVATGQSTQQWLADDDAIASDTIVEVEDPILGPTRQAGFALKFGTKPTVRFPRREPGTDTRPIENEIVKQRSRTRADDNKSSVDFCGTIAVDAIDDHPPLAGLKVLDFTALIAGPTGGRILAEYGAEVIKVNRPSIGHNRADPLSDDAFAMFGHRTTGAGKKTIFLDLKSPEGKKIAAELISGADIVHTIGTEEGVSKLGLDEKAVRAINSSVIYSRVTAYARGGWRYGMRGHEDCAERVTGLAMRYGGGIPDQVHGTIICDFGAGHFTALGVLLVVFDRLNRGDEADVQPSVVEASLTQTATYMQLPYMVAFPGAEWNEPAGRSARGWSTTDRLYQTSDGWIWIKAFGEAPVASLVAATQVDLDLRPLEDATVESKLEAQLLLRPGREWERVLEESGIASHVYCDTDALLKDSIVKARGLIIERYHPALGWGREVGVIRRFRSRPDPGVSPAAAPGHHTLEVLRALNYSDDALDELLAKHVIATDAYQDEARDREQSPVP